MMLPTSDNSTVHAVAKQAPRSGGEAQAPAERRLFTASTRPLSPFVVSPERDEDEPGAPGGGDADQSSLEYAALDGVTHINIYSRGKSDLGMLLSHFTRSPFVHPFYGPFDSMEGFWYYMKAERKNDRLRQLSGFEAKLYGKALKPGPRRTSFYEVIVEANFHKIVQNPELKRLMTASVLPFDHYYLWGAGPIFVRPPGFEWLVQGFEAIRQELKNASRRRQEPVWATPVYDTHID